MESNGVLGKRQQVRRLDQLKDVIEMIKKTPDSRRLLVSVLES